MLIQLVKPPKLNSRFYGYIFGAFHPAQNKLTSLTAYMNMKRNRTMKFMPRDRREKVNMLRKKTENHHEFSKTNLIGHVIRINIVLPNLLHNKLKVKGLARNLY